MKLILWIDIICVVVGVVQQESCRSIGKWDGVSVSYNGVHSLIVAIGVHVCSTITSGGVCDRTKV
jgi:hypothetical protein